MIRTAVLCALALFVGCEKTSSLGLAQIDAGTGGSLAKGGATGNGGAFGKGGVPGSGGTRALAGASGSGGASPFGGAIGTGGYYIGSTGPGTSAPQIDAGGEASMDAVFADAP